MARKANVEQWAKLGAIVRLKEIQEELAAIYKVFPDLKGKRPLAPSASSDGRKKRGRFSVEGRKAISEGMRNYWARRKARAARTAKPAVK